MDFYHNHQYLLNFILVFNIDIFDGLKNLSKLYTSSSLSTLISSSILGSSKQRPPNIRLSSLFSCEFITNVLLINIIVKKLVSLLLT